MSNKQAAETLIAVITTIGGLTESATIEGIEKALAGASAETVAAEVANFKKVLGTLRFIVQQSK